MTVPSLRDWQHLPCSDPGTAVPGFPVPPLRGWIASTLVVLSYDAAFLSPLRGLAVCAMFSHGLRRGLHPFAAPRLEHPSHISAGLAAGMVAVLCCFVSSNMP